MRRGIRTVKMRGLWIHPRSGLPYYRTRRGGKTRLVALPAELPHDHPDFIAAWAAAARGTDAPAAPKAGTLASSWSAALDSEMAATVSDSYRRILERHAKAICAEVGHVRIGAVQTKHIRANVTAARDQSGRLKTWRFWGRYCVSRGWLDSNPAEGARKDTRKSAGHPTWTRDDIAAFRAAYPIGSSPRAIMELCYWTGARISDVVSIGPQHARGTDGVLAFRQIKTDDMAYVPWTSDLPAYAAELDRDRQLCMQSIAHMAGGNTFLQTQAGRPRSSKSAGQDIAAACRAIGLELSAHGLRKARSATLAEHGATTLQIASWTGHRSLSEIERYTREMNRRKSVVRAELETNPAKNGNHR